MNRDNFIKGCMAAVVLVASPVTLLAKAVRNFRVGQGFAVKSGKDRFEKPLSVFDGDTFTTKISTKDTDGDIYVYESSRMKEGGPATHYHFDQDEWWYVLQGEFQIKVGDTLHNAKAGDSVFGPRNVPHTFHKLGEGEGKLLMVFQPAGKMEAFFTKVAGGELKGLSEEQLDKIREEHGFKRVGPPLKILKGIS